MLLDPLRLRGATQVTPCAAQWGIAGTDVHHSELQKVESEYHQLSVPVILVGGLEHVFPYIGNVIIPTDEVHHFSEG